jgi:hypothetical protein
MPSIENQNSEMCAAEQDQGSPEIRQTVALVQSQLAQLLQQRAALVKRIAMIRRAIKGLNTIFADSECVQAETGEKRSTLKSNLIQSDRCLPEGAPDSARAADGA